MSIPNLSAPRLIRVQVGATLRPASIMLRKSARTLGILLPLHNLKIDEVAGYKRPCGGELCNGSVAALAGAAANSADRALELRCLA